MKFSLGDLVVEKTIVQPNYSLSVYKVAAIVDGSLLLEYYGNVFEDGEVEPCSYTSKPGTRGWRQSFHRYQEEEIFTVEEALQESRRLAAVKNEMEKEFEGVRSQIQSKMDQAANLVQEAADLAKTYNKDFYLLKDECRSLYKAMTNGGWSHSSMKC